MTEKATTAGSCYSCRHRLPRPDSTNSMCAKVCCVIIVDKAGLAEGGFAFPLSFSPSHIIRCLGHEPIGPDQPAERTSELEIQNKYRVMYAIFDGLNAITCSPVDSKALFENEGLRPVLTAFIIFQNRVANVVEQAINRERLSNGGDVCAMDWVKAGKDALKIIGDDEDALDIIGFLRELRELSEAEHPHDQRDTPKLG